MKIKTYITTILFNCLLLISPCATAQSANSEIRKECFMLLVGKDASADGSVLLAHNNDLSGTEKSHIVKHERKLHAFAALIRFPSGLYIPQADTTYAWLSLEIEKGYAEGDAVAINEYGVAIAGGVALKPDRNAKAAAADPLIEMGVTGGIRYIALQRSKTARQCVKMLGDFYTRYGVTYPSGVGIADTSEIWYIESGGGYSWAAVRVPDSCYWAQANGYRIGFVDPGDTLNYYCSPGLLDFCKSHKLWNPENGDFDFADAFGGGRRERNEKAFYDTRRIWRCQDTLNPGLELSSNLTDYPGFLVPEEKISLEQCFQILRDRYEGSDFENFVDDRGIQGERPIGSWNAVHTEVVQLTPRVGADEGAILWAGIGAPMTTCYVPHFFGVEEIHPAFGEVASRNDKKSAFEYFREIAKIARHDKAFEAKVREAFHKIESEAIEDVREFSGRNDRFSRAERAEINLKYSRRVMEAFQVYDSSDDSKSPDE